MLLSDDRNLPMPLQKTQISTISFGHSVGTGRTGVRRRQCSRPALFRGWNWNWASCRASLLLSGQVQVVFGTNSVKFDPKPPPLLGIS